MTSLMGIPITAGGSHHLLRWLIKERGCITPGTLGLTYLGSRCRALPLRAGKTHTHTHCSFFLHIDPSLDPLGHLVLFFFLHPWLSFCPVLFYPSIKSDQWTCASFHYIPTLSSLSLPFFPLLTESRSFCNIELQLPPRMTSTYTHVSPGNHSFTPHPLHPPS